MNVDHNEFFRQATIRICGSLDIEVALMRCLHYIKDFLPVTRMRLQLYDPELNVMQTIASVFSEGEDGLARILPFPEEAKERIVSRWTQLEEIDIINQPDLHHAFRKGHGLLGDSLDFSMMTMRLELEGTRVGILVLSTKGTHQYTQDHAQLVLVLHDPFAIAMSNALQHQELLRLRDVLSDDNRYLRRQLLNLSGSEVIGADFGLRDVMEMVRQVASLDSPVLLLGETGVGKDVIANVIHNSSPRRDGPIIKVNCGAIPDSLIDSELFGHEKGAFTGAISQKRGRFERANRGTIFLDEIGELPSHAQVRLLHVLQNREIERVGGSKSIPVDIRIISATNKNLEEMLKSGDFREDLWFRLNVFPIVIPPLRERKEDIPELVHYFIKKKSRELKLRQTRSLAIDALEQLKSYDWPGNVRELQNIVERALIQQRQGPLRFQHLLSSQSQHDELIQKSLEPSDILSLNELNSRYIRQILDRTKGKISGPGGAAELLHIHPNTLRKRMEKLGIPYKRKQRG